MENSIQIATAYSVRPLFTAILVVAMAFTFSCSGDDDSGGGSSGGGSNLPQGGYDLCKYYDNAFPSLSNCNDKETVTIGSQVWQKCNSKVVPSKGAYGCLCNKSENCDKHGRLYDWEAAAYACPSGFHLPTAEEWDILVDYAGGKDVAGEKLKAKNFWEEEREGHNGTDDFGFTALPSGFYTHALDGAFTSVGSEAEWWTATEDNSNTSWALVKSITGEYSSIGNATYDKTVTLHSVRCIKD